MQVLENEHFCVQINELGAEVTSFVSKRDGTEYIWQADPAIWPRHAPMLFPIIGRLRDKTYTVNGAAYNISQHGFARDLPFSVQREQENTLTFTLRQNEQTHAVYPWDFTLHVRYTLSGGTLKKEHIVINDSSSTMYYEIGGHDGFSLCRSAEEKNSDYYLCFEGTAVLHPLKTDADVFLTREHGVIELVDGCLPITPKTFENDTIVLDDLAVRRVTLACRKNEKRVVMDFADFPYFAVWSPKKDCEVPLVCMEPWSTLPECGYLDHALENKVGVRVLQAGERQSLAFSTTIFE